VTLVFRDSVDSGLAGRLPEEVRSALCPSGTLGLRTPAHDAVLHALRFLPGPLVLAGIEKDGQPAVTAQQAADLLGDEAAVIVDDGPCRFGRRSTVVEVAGNQMSVLREGVVPGAVVMRQSVCLIVFVCTGNTCRSPLAEALCKKLLADRLSCAVDELPARGFLVLSAGLAAMMEGAAAEEAVTVARTYGADLSLHRSRPLSADLVEQADYLFVMTQGHRQAVAAQYPHLGPRPQLLSPDGADVADPVGCDQQVYEECARQLWQHLQRFVAELPSECFAPAGTAGRGE
jgi:protein-tyrosine phosphatase